MLLCLTAVTKVYCMQAGAAMHGCHQMAVSCSPSAWDWRFLVRCCSCVVLCILSGPIHH